jgi:hypothetical protein
MVRRGSSFKEVADVLGHTSLKSTAIYASGELLQISIKFHWSVEMMEANDMLLWTPLRHRVRVLAKIEEFRPKIEEFHLATAEPDGAHR